ncbi:MAG: DUF4376 domain-containing protein [Desulfobacterales bacterium]|nr:DUF4376 domain-containing protein [Desulfobacterales bacterium]
MNTTYTYDEKTGVLNGTGAYEIGIDDKKIIAAFETLDIPPEFQKGKIARFLTEEGSVPIHCTEGGSWVVHDDLRGTSYYKKDGTKVEITAIGELVPEEVMDTVPPDFSNEHNGTSWIIDYDSMRESKLSEAKSARKIYEISGVSVVGLSCVDFNLETDDTGQTKIFGAFLIAAQDLENSVTTKWKTLSGWRDVTNSDIIKMGLAVRNHINNSFARLEEIEDEINELPDSEVENYKIEFDMA